MVLEDNAFFSGEPLCDFNPPFILVPRLYDYGIDPFIGSEQELKRGRCFQKGMPGEDETVNTGCSGNGGVRNQAGDK